MCTETPPPRPGPAGRGWLGAAPPLGPLPRLLWRSSSFLPSAGGAAAGGLFAFFFRLPRSQLKARRRLEEPPALGFFLLGGGVAGLPCSAGIQASSGGAAAGALFFPDISEARRAGGGAGRLAAGHQPRRGGAPPRGAPPAPRRPAPRSQRSFPTAVAPPPGRGRALLLPPRADLLPLVLGCLDRPGARGESFSRTGGRAGPAERSAPGCGGAGRGGGRTPPPPAAPILRLPAVAPRAAPAALPPQPALWGPRQVSERGGGRAQCPGRPAATPGAPPPAPRCRRCAEPSSHFVLPGPGSAG